MNNYSISTLIAAAGMPDPGPVRSPRLRRAIYSQLSDQERSILGEIQLGKELTKPFAYTHRGDGSGANLCLELSGGQIELNLVGWKMEQASAVRDWLMTYPAEKAIRSVPSTR